MCWVNVSYLVKVKCIFSYTILMSIVYFGAIITVYFININQSEVCKKYLVNKT